MNDPWLMEEVDKDGSGTLEADELYDLIAGMTGLETSDLSLVDCKRFVDVFDANSDGVIDREEWANFCAFVVVMGWLERQESNSVDTIDNSARLVREMAVRIGDAEFGPLLSDNERLREAKRASSR